MPLLVRITLAAAVKYVPKSRQPEFLMAGSGREAGQVPVGLKWLLWLKLFLCALA